MPFIVMLPAYNTNYCSKFVAGNQNSIVDFSTETRAQCLA